MTLNKNEKLAFARSILNTFNLSGFSIDNNIALTSIQIELEEELNDLNSDETKEARFRHFNIKGTKPDDYTERIINVGEKNRKIICGIRHEVANPDYPFIHIIPNFEIIDDDVLFYYENFLKNYFSIFKPLQVRLWRNSDPHHILTGSTYLASYVGDIMNLPNWPVEDQITFKKIEDDSYYDWYKCGYKEFHKSFPDLKNRVQLNDKSVMQSSIDDNLIAYVEKDGEQIGLIAAENKKFLGNRGIYFNEIFISKKWKGRGLAKAIQRKFIIDFCNKDDLVWGTIDYQNRSSYKTALSNGRKAIRFECFIPLLKEN